MATLENCPLCGHLAFIKWKTNLVYNGEINGYEAYLDKPKCRPQCQNCGCTIDRWFPTADDAIKAWNNRT